MNDSARLHQHNYDINEVNGKAMRLIMEKELEAQVEKKKEVMKVEKFSPFSCFVEKDLDDGMKNLKPVRIQNNFA